MEHVRVYRLNSMQYKCFSDTFSNAKQLLKLQNDYYLSAALDFDNIYNKTNYI